MMQVRNLSFHYKGCPEVLKDVSFHMAPMGRITGLITVLANRSPSRSSVAPPKIEPGIRYT